MPESLQKALRSLEIDLDGLDEIAIPKLGEGDDVNTLRAALGRLAPERIRIIAQALRAGMTVDEIHRICRIDKWFLDAIEDIVRVEERVRKAGLPKEADGLRALKAQGFSDARLGKLAGLKRRGRGALA